MSKIKLALTATLTLAIVLTFSCSGDDGGNDNNPVVVSSSSKNTGVSSSSEQVSNSSSSSEQSEISSSSSSLNIENSSSSDVEDISSSSEQSESSSSFLSSSSSSSIESSSSSSEQDEISSSSAVINVSSSSSETNNGWELYYVKPDNYSVGTRFIINLADFDGWSPDKAEFFTEQKMYFENTTLITMMANQPKDGVKVSWDESTATKVPFDGANELALEGGDCIKQWGLKDDGESIWIRFATAGYPIPFKLIYKVSQ